MKIKKGNTRRSSLPVHTNIRKKGLVTLKTLFIDDTKIEANANRYTFVWRGTVNYHLAGLLDTIDKLYLRYNQFLQSQNYNKAYNLPLETMFVVEGIDKVKPELFMMI